MNPLIRLKGLTRDYQMGEHTVRALRGLDLEIDAGEFVAIIGPSGSGKSTLMYLLGCLDRPSAGEYWLGGEEVSGLSDGQLSRTRNRDIGFVFQHYNLLSELTVLENVALGLVYRGQARGKRLKRAEDLANRLGLEGRHQHSATELSGGQMQRVAICRALAGAPHLLLCDEPTGNLDSVTGKEIMAVFHELHAQGNTIIMVTHDPKVAAQAERIIRIQDGLIESDERQPGSTRAASKTEARKPATRVRWFDIARIAIREGLLAHKLRTALTMLGIVFGIAAVIAMTAITEGGKRQQLEQIRQIGLNNIQVLDNQLEGERLRQARQRNPFGISDRDVEAIHRELPELEGLTAWKTLNADVSRGRIRLEFPQVLGVRGDFQEVVNFAVGQGRFLRERDTLENRRVCVLGAEIAKALEIAGSPLGADLIIGDQPFTVVGVMQHRPFTASSVKDVNIVNRNHDVYIPHAVLMRYYPKEDRAGVYDTVSLRMATTEQLVSDSQHLERVLRSLHDDADDFAVSVPLENLRQSQKTKEVFNVIITVIAGMSLLVGGIGIMNIMLASVSERTREIGIRRAVGATRREVLKQFLAEAGVISMIGGALGVVTGILGGELVAAGFQFPVAFNLAIMGISVGVAVAIGIGFGLYPAWVAARMDPVDALRG
jgi:macrolide transport system ATP-binding/permease protein